MILSRRDVLDWFVHLRLNFQILLSPIFLWGFVLAGGRLTPALVLGYVSFHLFGYAGGTAFNSYYDRDTGPIGGLEHPPPVPRGLLPFSIAWQVLGFLIALGVGAPFAVIYAIMFCLSLAYSHPRLRFKGKPLAALLTVAVGQGVLGYLGGWVSARGDALSALTPVGILGAAGATFLTVGFYPLTEIYQIVEDEQRGDLTLAAWLGPVNSFRFALAGLLLGGVAAIVLVAVLYRLPEAIFLAFWIAILMFAVRRWSRSFAAENVFANFRTVMRLYSLTSLGFIAWTGLHLFGIL